MILLRWYGPRGGCEELRVLAGATSVALLCCETPLQALSSIKEIKSPVKARRGAGVSISSGPLQILPPAFLLPSSTERRDGFADEAL